MFFSQVWDAFGRHSKIFVMVAAIVVSLSSVYFFLYKKERPYYRYYLAGYLLVLVGIVISLSRILFSVRSWVLMILSLIFYIVGFAVVLYGGKKKRAKT